MRYDKKFVDITSLASVKHHFLAYISGRTKKSVVTKQTKRYLMGRYPGCPWRPINQTFVLYVSYIWVNADFVLYFLEKRPIKPII